MFKDDCFSIDSALRSTWNPLEVPIAYIRNGDHDDFSRKFESHGFSVKNHPAGYRSVHYIFSTQPLQRKVIAEMQVRTIFEEGWSEIDHNVRYPNFSDDELVGYFLTVFNRLAGIADEMGGFVKGLASSLREFQSQLTEANSEKNKAFERMEAVVAELEQMKQQGAATQTHISNLKSELMNLRQTAHDSSNPINRAIYEERDHRMRIVEALEVLNRLPENFGAVEAARKALDNLSPAQRAINQIIKERKPF